MIVENWKDEKGRPAGGVVSGEGFTVSWQNGPLKGTPTAKRNGAFVEDLIKASVARLEHYQLSDFACEENAEALDHLNKALAALNRRTQKRVDRGVEGTHEV